MKKICYILFLCSLFFGCTKKDLQPDCTNYTVYSVVGKKGCETCEYGTGFFLMSFCLDSIEAPQSKWIDAGTCDWSMIAKIQEGIKNKCSFKICVNGNIIEDLKLDCK